MSFRDLINLIYGIRPGQRVIYCSHCGRPLKQVKDSDGKGCVVCPHCFETWKESQEEMERNLRINAEKHRRWEQRSLEREGQSDEE